MAGCLNMMRATGTVFPEAEIARMLQQLLTALTFIHAHHILHRDLKPSNILIDKNGDLKIADFGVSRIMTETTCNAQTSVGTANYMPPEMCKKRPYTYHSDMWSLGCVLYEMVTLRSAFTGDSLIALAWNVCFENPPVVQGYSRVRFRLLKSLGRNYDDLCKLYWRRNLRQGISRAGCYSHPSWCISKMTCTVPLCRFDLLQTCGRQISPVSSRCRARV